ncbi:hypothetical protein Mal64_34500 [Pseudobythopirellula maris]|uniref:Lipoprotein n=1 Tax=Pseudobythopirellula maris TaxID=2527991 RepID=A0A5C5ZH12_9BACT|nr:hypothetical protein [Pseudobythopirellula maris]TWT86622.1 hypothetical protein Mal64_34500 [Pseudobythopirellula maris]
MARTRTLPRPQVVTAALLVGSLSLGSSGCFWGLASQGPSLGIAAIPIPVSPYFQKKKEDDHWQNERYERVPILGPITSGGPPIALDTPSDDEVIRALEKADPIEGGIPLLWERNRNNVRIVKCKMADYVDPVRVYPMIGPAQQHHAHYKCTIYYEDVRRVGWPVPHTLRDEDAQEVVYIDHNHLHMVGDVEPCHDCE